MAASEHEWARRIKAAAAYAGLERRELAKRLGMSDSTLRRHLVAEKRPHEIRALCQTVAEITGLPYAFFTIDFAQLPLLAAAEISRIQPLSEGGEGSPENLVLVLGHVHERLAAIEDELGLRDATRRTGQALGAALDAADAAETEAAASTRDEADASQEDEPARPRARPRTAEQTGG